MYLQVHFSTRVQLDMSFHIPIRLKAIVLLQAHIHDSNTLIRLLFS